MPKSTPPIGWLAGMLLLIACGHSAAHQARKKTTGHGFDKLCEIYTQVFTQKKYAKLSFAQKIASVDTKVHHTLVSVDDIPAIEAYSAGFMVDPKIHYKLLTQAAEYSLKRPWKCNAIKKVFDIIIQKAKADNVR